MCWCTKINTDITEFRLKMCHWMRIRAHNRISHSIASILFVLEYLWVNYFLSEVVLHFHFKTCGLICPFRVYTSSLRNQNETRFSRFHFDFKNNIICANLVILGHLHFQVGRFLTEFAQIQSFCSQNTHCRNGSKKEHYLSQLTGIVADKNNLSRKRYHKMFSPYFLVSFSRKVKHDRSLCDFIRADLIFF